MKRELRIIPHSQTQTDFISFFYAVKRRMLILRTVRSPKGPRLEARNTYVGRNVLKIRH